MKICIISSLGCQTYAEKFLQSPSYWLPFWQKALFHDGLPIDVVNYWHLLRNQYFKGLQGDRHLFMSGVVLTNKFCSLGFTVFLINTFIPHQSSQTEYLSSADYIIISTNYITGDWVKSLSETCSYIRMLKPNTKIIVGGFGIYRSFYDKNQRSSLFKKIQALKLYAIIVSRDGIKSTMNAIRCQNTQSEVYQDNDYPVLHPNEFSFYNLSNDIKPKHTTIITAQGCPFNCSYCSYKYFLGSPKYMKASNAVDIVKTVCKEPGSRIKYFRIADECFNFPSSRGEKICQGIIDLEIEQNWCCFLRADHVSEEFVKILKLAGCDMVSLGLETGSQSLQGIMNKNLNLELVKKTIDILKKYDICVTTSLLVGYYGENDITISDTMRFLRESSPDLVRINVWSPPPDESTKYLAKRYKFKHTKNGWQHSSLTEIQAIGYASELFSNNLGSSFLPPFSSVFDQWPELSCLNSNSQDRIKIFTQYYDSTINRIH